MHISDQAQYRAIFDNASEAIAVIDSDGAIISANRAVERIFGYASNEIVGRDFGVLMPESGRPALFGRRRGDWPTGLREVAGRRKDGTVFPVDLSVARWEREGQTFFTGIMRDTSRRRDAETARADGALHLASLYRQSAAGLAETDKSGRFVSANDRYCEIAGRSREALLRLRVHDIAHPDDHQRTLPFFERLTAADPPESIEKRYVRGDGSIAWVTVTASPVRVEGGEELCLLVVIDVTQRKLSEEALRLSEEKLRLLQNDFAHLARVNDLGEMAAAIAHEINQPLTAIANYLSAGLKCVASESVAKALAAARKAMKLANEQSARAGNIVRGLREFVVKGAGVRQVESAAALVDSAMALALFDVGKAGIQVELESGAEGVSVEVDPVQIQQVLVNLLRNAVDALATNGAHAERRLTIGIGVPPGEDVVEFRVADTGPGIAADLCGRLFEPFMTSKAKGMGMGLSVCRRIVEAHGGRIGVESEPGSGAVFTIALPRHDSIPNASNKHIPFAKICAQETDRGSLWPTNS